ncbi:MAG: DUF3027 domain-containing protein [Nocardioidaceae bacterium]
MVKVKPKKAPKPDEIGLEAVDFARTALLEQVPADDVGEHLGALSDAAKVTTHLFECKRAGYAGWRWSVTVARAARQKSVTLDEVVLLPGDDAIVAPAWVPWRDRIRPGDLSPGDLLPAEDDDPRLAPAYTAADETVSAEEFKAVSDELGLGRPRVLSIEGRELAAERWHQGSHGPDAAIAQSAPGRCVGCGFLVRLRGPLSQAFGVCANAYANDDGRVVSFDHGCGAHSEARLGKRNQPQPLPEPVLDTLTWDDLDTF